VRNNKEDVVGRVFPTTGGTDFIVTDYESYSSIIVKFLDKYGYETKTSVDSAQKGHVNNPYAPSLLGRGFSGVGRHKKSIGGKLTPEYRSWSGAMYRCYGEDIHIRQPTYSGCSVCGDWWNFQEFSDWYVNNKFYGLGYQLDKDILVQGNKVYSPDTCTLIPKELNCLLTDCGANRGEFPQGVTFDKRRGRYVSSIRPDNSTKHLGYYDSAGEAYTVYKIAKELRVKEKALEWEGRIEDKVFNKLMSWTLD